MVDGKWNCIGNNFLEFSENVMQLVKYAEHFLHRWEKDKNLICFIS